MDSHSVEAVSLKGLVLLEENKGYEKGEGYFSVWFLCGMSVCLCAGSDVGRS